MNKKYFNKYIIISTISFIILLIIIKGILLNNAISYDNSVYNVISNNLRSNEMTLFMMIITGFGSFIFFTLSFVVLYILYKNKKTINYLLINTVTIFLLNDFIKHLFSRERPTVVSLVKENGFSFPSSHVMVSVVFYGLLIYLIYKNINKKIIKYILITTLILLIILIGISRIYLGVHYFSDVVGGLSISIIYIMIFLMFNKDFEKKV